MMQFRGVCSRVFMAVALLLEGGVPGVVASVPPASFAPLVDKVLPAVVDITTQLTPEYTLDAPSLSIEDLLREHLDKQLQEQPKRATSGSGFIIEATDQAAWIVTNFHVIDGADAIYVKLSQDVTLDGKPEDEHGKSAQGAKGIVAEVVGKDRRTDIALLKIKTTQKLPVLALADSAKVRTGDYVLSVGNPFGFGSTVTAGIVSKKARDISDQTRPSGIGDYIREYIQTDASINSGSSGGPLINVDGAVIGVNAIIYSPNGGNLGIAFAIPSNTVCQTVDQLKQYGRSRRGWLGILVQKVSVELAENVGLSQPKGVAVSSIYPQSPAAKAGFQEGDIVLSINNTEIKDVRDVPYLVGELPVGKSVSVKVWRQEKELTLKVSVGDYEEAEEKGLIQNPYNRDHPTKSKTGLGKTLLGMTLQDITPRSRQYYGLKEDLKGALVTKVQKNSLAAEQGIQQGDVIMKVDREEISSVDGFFEKIEHAQKKHKKSVVLIVNIANDASKIVVLKLKGTPKTNVEAE